MCNLDVAAPVRDSLFAANAKKCVVSTTKIARRTKLRERNVRRNNGCLRWHKVHINDVHETKHGVRKISETREEAAEKTNGTLRHMHLARKSAACSRPTGWSLSRKYAEISNNNWAVFFFSAFSKAREGEKKRTVLPFLEFLHTRATCFSQSDRSFSVFKAG